MLLSYSLRDKIAKIYQHINRGDRGEIHAAEKALERMMKKHNLSESDLESITKKEYRFKYSTDLEILLFNQLLTYFIDDNYEDLYRDLRGVRELVVRLEYVDFVTISCAYEYFRSHMRKQYRKAVLPQLSRFRKRKNREARRMELSHIFFSKYILASGIYKPEQVGIGHYTSLKEIQDRVMMQVEGGEYRTQISTGLYLEKSN